MPPISKMVYKHAKKQMDVMPWWIELIWMFNFAVITFGRTKKNNGRPR